MRYQDGAPGRGVAKAQRTSANLPPPSRFSAKRRHTPHAVGFADTPRETRLGKLREDPQPIPQQAGHEEMGANVLLARPTELLSERGIAQDLDRALRSLLGRVHEE